MSSQNSTTAKPSPYPVPWEQDDDFKRLKGFVTCFFQDSDIAGDVEQWLKYFVDGAHVQMGTQKPVCDKGALRDLRKQMWKDVRTRKHTVTRVFPAKFPDWPADDLGFMAFGTVEYGWYDNGGGLVKEWAAHGHLKKGDDGDYRLAYYQVYDGPQRMKH